MVSLLSEFEYIVRSETRVERHLEKPLPAVLLSDCLLFTRMQVQHKSSHSAQAWREGLLCIATMPLQGRGLYG